MKWLLIAILRTKDVCVEPSYESIFSRSQSPTNVLKVSVHLRVVVVDPLTRI